MNYDEAMTVLARSVGAEVDAFCEGRPLPVEDTAGIQAAGKVLLDSIRANPDSLPMDGYAEDVLIAGIIQETKAQTFEAIWHTFARDTLKTPEGRAKLLGFMEERAGRPLGIDPDVPGSLEGWEDRIGAYRAGT